MGAAPASEVSRHEAPEEGTCDAAIQAAATVTAKPWSWRVLNTLLYYLERPFVDRSVGRTYLEGGFAPARQELFAGNLEIVEGSIPASLHGCFVRNGPNPQFDVPGGYHWFDGDGMVHSVRIRGGKAAYSNRYVRTAKLQQEQCAGYAAAGRLGKMKGARGLVNMGLDKLKHLVGILDKTNGLSTANTSLAFHAGRLLALNEGDLPYALRLACNGLVSTLGRVTYGGAVHHAFTAHPKIDPVTREMFAFGYSVNTAPYCWYMRLDARGRLVADFPVPLPAGVMMHDFAMTERYVIFMDCPLLFKPEAMVRDGSLPFQYEKNRGMRFGVLDRYAADSSGITWLSTRPGLILHSANAWEADEEGTRIELYACVFNDFSLDEFSAASDDSEPHLSRISLDLATGEASVQQLAQGSTDFPVVPASLLGRKSKYAYCATFSTGKANVPLFWGVGKYDLEAAGAAAALAGLIRHGEGRLGGEAYFIPKGGAAAEDDGYLMTFVYDEGRQGSELVIYDAATMSSKPVARIRIPQRVPHGFHCTWVTEEQMMQQARGLDVGSPPAAAES